MAANPEIFEQKLMVEQSHLDEQNHVNNVQYVQWVQDVAKAHWESRAPIEFQEKYLWMVVRHEIDYKKQAFLNDEILLQTYVAKSSHVKSLRHVIIKNAKTEEVLVEAKTTWALIDKVSQKPSKIAEDLIKIFEQ